MVYNQKNPDLKFSDIKGTCNVERAFVYSVGQWVNLLNPNMEMDSTFAMKGAAIKVAGDCALSVVRPSTNIQPPPALP